MQIGRFFSLGGGRVGQYLSERVLVVRMPFRSLSRDLRQQEGCCFGFRDLKQAQRFVQFLSRSGYPCRMRSPEWLHHYPYEVVLWGLTDPARTLARTLAYWERHEPHPAPSDRLAKGAIAA